MNIIDLLAIAPFYIRGGNEPEFSADTSIAADVSAVQAGEI
jgi:hypothetical protein